jgi:hypothetical protein
MRTFVVVLAATLTLSPLRSADPGQTGTAAGDDARLAELHDALLPMLQTGRDPDPDSLEALADVYLSGLGVPRDPVLACSLLKQAFGAAVFRYNVPEHPVVARLAIRQEDVCGSLGEEARSEAEEMMACPRFGTDTEQYALDAGRFVEVSRRGIRVQHPGGSELHPFPGGCGQRLALVRHARIDPPPDTDWPVRHLIELYVWMAGVRDRLPMRSLEWFLLEIVQGAVEVRAGETLLEEPGSIWQPMPVPADLLEVSFTMQASGKIAVGATRPRARREPTLLAALERPAPEPPRDAPRLPTSGTAYLDVTAVDRSGIPVPDAEVILTGVVSRTISTGETGTASLDGLPSGRYDVVVRAPGLAPNAPRVVDLSDGKAASVEVTLKPNAPTGSVTIGCGGLIPRTLADLASNADAILLVRIADRLTLESQSPEAGPLQLTTVNRVRVVGVFKGAETTPGARDVPIIQLGGSIDRGDYIQHHDYNGHAPLNVGDEYVLFVRRESAGSLGIVAAREGAFRLRNRRVEPLGSGVLAEAWKERSAIRFIEAVRAQVAAPLNPHPGRP